MPRHAKEDGGFTLIELLVYSMLLVLVVVIAGGMLMSVLRNSTTVQTVSDATTAGQLVADSVESGIRNSSDFQLTNPAGTDQLLIARTASSGATLTWSCVAWYYSAGDGSIRTMRSGAAILPPTSADLATWTLLDDGVAPGNGTTVFTAEGDRLLVDFKSVAQGHPPIDINTAAMSRAGASGAITCF